MKKLQAALALALLGAVCTLCLRGLERVGAHMAQEDETQKKTAP